MNRAWKLIKEAVPDWPLALCDASTVDVDLDVVPADMLYEKVVTENSIVHYNPKQKWYYLSGQKESEMLLFVGADSEASAFSGEYIQPGSRGPTLLKPGY